MNVRQLLTSLVHPSSFKILLRKSLKAFCLICDSETCIEQSDVGRHSPSYTGMGMGHNEKQFQQAEYKSMVQCRATAYVL